MEKCDGHFRNSLSPTPVCPATTGYQTWWQGLPEDVFHGGMGRENRWWSDWKKPANKTGGTTAGNQAYLNAPWIQLAMGGTCMPQMIGA